MWVTRSCSNMMVPVLYKMQVKKQVKNNIWTSYRHFWARKGPINIMMELKLPADLRDIERLIQTSPL